MRLVDADKILEKLETGLDNPEEFPVMGLGAIMRLINNEPEVQSAQPEIIRCKDCKHYHTDVCGSELGIGGMYENIIVAHDACDRWTKGMNCVEPEGFCFLAERNE